MSWSDIFPILTDEMVDAFESEASEKEKAALDDLFGVKEVINFREVDHYVCTSLFWRNSTKNDPELPSLNREILTNALELNLVERFSPMEHYVTPLVEASASIHADRNDVAVRVYLAADLHFLLDDLIGAGCEVHLMNSSSIRHNPGAMWRFLALEEQKNLTIIDSDRAHWMNRDIERTNQIATMGLGLWRLPAANFLTDFDEVAYRPMIGGQFGVANNPVPAGLLLRSLVWHHWRGSMPIQCMLPGACEKRMWGSTWPDYGFDEWALLSAFFPRLIMGGTVSFLSIGMRSRLLPLDIEYVMWANPDSELVYYGSIEDRRESNDSCCESNDSCCESNDSRCEEESKECEPDIRLIGREHWRD